MRALRPRLQEDTRTDAPALAELIDRVWSEIEGSLPLHSTRRLSGESLPASKGARHFRR